jgi:hypothetical protein
MIPATSGGQLCTPRIVYLVPELDADLRIERERLIVCRNSKSAYACVFAYERIRLSRSPQNPNIAAGSIAVEPKSVRVSYMLWRAKMHTQKSCMSGSNARAEASREDKHMRLACTCHL